MEKIQKRGITIVTLVITIIILVLLTGAVMLTMNNTDIFGQTKNTVDEHNKQAIIEQINLEIETEMIKKVNEIGRYEQLSKEETINIINKYGTYEDNTLKLTTREKNISIYLYEIIGIQVEEYVTATYRDKILTITEKEESLSSNGYKYEYTYDNGVIWQTYTSPIAIQEQSGIKVRIVNSEGKVVSNEYVVTKGAGEETVNKIKQIAVTKTPTTTTYKQGQTFNPTGMEITVTYEDNTKKVVTNYNYTPTRALTVSDRYITISYTENGVTKHATQSITVTNKLTAIGITELKKTKYKQGETINKSDIVVRATYEDNTNKQVTNFTYEPTRALQASDTSITVTYTEGDITKQASKDIQVTYASVLEITSEPIKTGYIKGENFDTEGIIVTVIYADGTTKILENTEYEIVNGTNLQVGTSEIIIRYTEGGITIENSQAITVNKVLSSIAITTSPTLTYNYGGTFSTSGMVVTATYSDNSTEDITSSCTTSPENGTTLDHSNTTLTVTYEGKKATKTITVNKVLSDIAVTTAPTTTSYTVGQYFSTAGMVVIATYSDGSTANVTSSCTFNPTTSTALTTSHTSVTITYEGKTTTQAIKVNNPSLGSQITKDNYGQSVNYTANGKTDWQIYYATSEYVFLIASSSIGESGLGENWNYDMADSSSLYSIMKLGQTGYLLDKGVAQMNLAPVGYLALDFSEYANTEEYKDSNGISYIVGAIGGPTLELLQARANELSPGAVTLGIGEYGYIINGNVSGYVDTGVPTGSKYIWLSSTSQWDARSIATAKEGYVTFRDYTDTNDVCPVVCLKSSIPASWNGTSWEI